MINKKSSILLRICFYFFPSLNLNFSTGFCLAGFLSLPNLFFPNAGFLSELSPVFGLNSFLSPVLGLNCVLLSVILLYFFYQNYFK